MHRPPEVPPAGWLFPAGSGNPHRNPRTAALTSAGYGAGVSVGSRIERTPARRAPLKTRYRSSTGSPGHP